MKLYGKAGLLLFCILTTFVSCSEELSQKIETDDRMSGFEEDVQDVVGNANVLLSEELASNLEDGEVLPADLGFDSLERLFPYSEKFEERKRREGLHRWYKASYSLSENLTKTPESFEGVPGIEKFVPAREACQTAFFNDPKAVSQWHYFNDGGLSSQFTAGADINVETVWQDYTVGDRCVVVAVIDQGVDYEHEDLAANYVGGCNFVTYGKVTADDHGTHVAGTIAAVNNNGIGVSGIAGGNALEGIQGVGILSCQIFSGSKSTQHSPEALVWAADNGAVIANNSWGYVFETPEASKKAVIDSDLKAAIDYFIKYAGCDNEGNQLPDSPMKGGVVIFAAGNDGWDSNPICAYEPVISVGSIGPDYSRAYYSNYGDWVDIAAPGGTAKLSSGQVVSTFARNKYGELQGTSMACPHVSGVAALIVSYHGGQGFTNEMLRERLIGGARYDRLPSSAKIGPLVDALGSITYGSRIAPEKVTNFKIGVIGNKVTVTLGVTKDEDDVKPFEYIVLLSPSSASLNGIDINALPEDVVMRRFKTRTAQVGKVFDLAVSGLEFEHDYYLCIAARDYAGNLSDWSDIRHVHTEANHLPVIVPDQDVKNIVVKSHQSVILPFHIYDPEGGELTVSVSKGLSGASVKRAEGGIWNLSITATIANPGSYSGELIATDIENMSSTYRIEYEILPNSAPVKLKEIGNLLSSGSGMTFGFDLTEYFSDPDGETLTYKITEGNNMVAKASLEGSVLTVTTSGPGSTSLTISAADGKKANAQMEVNIVVKDESNLVEVYPVPVVTTLYVRTGEPKPTDIVIQTMTGHILHEEKGRIISAFAPASIDMSQYAPGRYKVFVMIDGQKYDRIITKI